jgi:ribosomal protein S18 acetylase RimI-like enzyme
MSHPEVMFSFRNMKDEYASKIHNNDEDSLEMEDDEYFDEFSDWRSELRASAFIESSVPGEKPQEIGCGGAYIVNRPSIRGDWWGLMDGPDEEFQEFSMVLFNKRGYFRKELYEDPKKKGTGVFGPELGRGQLLYVQYIRVQAEYRRQGIGRKLVEGLQALAEQKVSILIHLKLSLTYFKSPGYLIVILLADSNWSRPSQRRS